MVWGSVAGRSHAEDTDRFSGFAGLAMYKGIRLAADRACSL